LPRTAADAGEDHLAGGSRLIRPGPVHAQPRVAGSSSIHDTRHLTGMLSLPRAHGALANHRIRAAFCAGLLRAQRGTKAYFVTAHCQIAVSICSMCGTLGRADKQQ